MYRLKKIERIFNQLRVLRLLILYLLCLYTQFNYNKTFFVHRINVFFKLELEDFSVVALSPSKYESMKYIQTRIFQVNQISQGQTFHLGAHNILEET